MTNSTIPSTILEQGTEFLAAIVEWARNLPSITWSDLAGEAAQGRVALFSVDMINGFCHEGGLSSPRVQGIIPAVVGAFKGAYAIGVRNFILAQDCHSPESVEFADFPPHCLAGTSEAETIPELASLPFADLYTIVTKNSLNAFHGTRLSAWLEAHRDLSTAVAREIGALPHSGDVLHLLFLYHMRLNGIEVVHFSDIARKEPEEPSQQEKAA